MTESDIKAGLKFNIGSKPMRVIDRDNEDPAICYVTAFNPTKRRRPSVQSIEKMSVAGILKHVHNQANGNGSRAAQPAEIITSLKRLQSNNERRNAPHPNGFLPRH